MPSRYFTVILEREEDGGYHAFCPSLKGVIPRGMRWMRLYRTCVRR